MAADDFADAYYFGDAFDSFSAIESESVSTLGNEAQMISTGNTSSGTGSNIDDFAEADPADSVGGVSEEGFVMGAMEDRVQNNDAFGRVLTTGDFNGDGYDDAAISVYDGNNGNFDGAVHVMYGSASGLDAVGDQLWHIDSPGINGSGPSSFGAAMAAGDFDGDGYDDLAIGSPGSVVDGIGGAGAVNVIYGSTGGLTSAGDQRWHQNRSGVEGVAETSDQFGAALAVGDFDGNGTEDLAIGVPGEDLDNLGFTDAGAVNVLYGYLGSGLSEQSDQIWRQGKSDFFGGTIEGDPHSYEYFGYSLAAGDFDGNGTDDLAIGVQRDKEDSDNINEGGSAVNVIYSTNTGLYTTDNRLWPFSAGQFAVGSILTAGDFDGNGKDDLAIGQPAFSFGLLDHTGNVLAMYGRSNGNGLRLVGLQTWSQARTDVLETREAEDWFGSALTAGDYNGDGRDDLSIGVPGENNYRGAVNTIYGSGPEDLTADGNQLWYQGRIDPAGTGTIIGNREADDRFGEAVASGDFNGDGYEDLLVGVPGEDFENTGGTINYGGVVNVIYGSSDGLTAAGDQLWHQDKSADTLIVRGRDDEVDFIRLDMHNGQIRIRVNSTTELVDPDNVTEIIVHSGAEDFVTLESLEPSNIADVQVNGTGTVILDATSEATGATWNLAPSSFSRSDWSYDVTASYSHLVLVASDGQNQVNVSGSYSNRDYDFIGGSSTDEFQFTDLDGHHGNVTIDGGGGTDTVRLHEPNNSSGKTYKLDGNTVSRAHGGNLKGNFEIVHQGVENVAVNAGQGGDEFNVLSTPAGVYTTIATGLRPDPSETIGTSPPPGPDVINLGDGNVGHNIQGHVHILGESGSDYLIIDDRPSMQEGFKEPGGDEDHRFHEFGGAIYTHSETEANVYYIAVEQVRLDASSDQDTINVQASSPLTEVTLSTGGGEDVVVLALDSQNLDSIKGPVRVEAGPSNDVVAYLYDSSLGGIVSYDVEQNSVTRAGFGGLEYDELEVLHVEGGPAFSASYRIYGSSAETTAIWGHGGTDQFQIYDSLFEQLHLRGGVGSDGVALLDGLEDATILPNPEQAGMGLMLIDEATVHYFEIEQLQADGLESLQYTTPNPDDVLQLTAAGASWHELDGSSGAVSLVPLQFRNVADLYLNLADHDFGAGNDSLSVTASDLPATGVEEVRVNSGTGDNQIDIQAGTLRLYASEGGNGVNTSLSVSNDSLVRFGQSEHLRSLSVDSGGEVELITSSQEMVIQTRSLDMGAAKNPEGTIQLNNHGLIIDYDKDSPISIVQSAIEHARDEHEPMYWIGTGITSSLAAASPDEIDVVATEAADVLPEGTGAFHGADLVQEQTAVLVEAALTIQPPLLPGDYNENGTVDAADYSVYRDMLGETVPPYSGADGNGNGVVDEGDYEVYKNNFGQTAGIGSGSSSQSVVGFAGIEIPLEPMLEPDIGNDRRAAARHIAFGEWPSGELPLSHEPPGDWDAAVHIAEADGQSDSSSRRIQTRIQTRRYSGIRV